jgi:hypothetical protein
MAQIIVGNEKFDDVEAAQKAMSACCGITEECALWYMLWDVSFEDDDVNDAFIAEQEKNEGTDVEYVEAYLKHEMAEDLVYQGKLKNYNYITEMN